PSPRRKRGRGETAVAFMRCAFCACCRGELLLQASAFPQSEDLKTSCHAQTRGRYWTVRQQVAKRGHWYLASAARTCCRRPATRPRPSLPVYRPCNSRRCTSPSTCFD